MNLLIVKPEELISASEARIVGPRAKYIYDFHNLRVGLTIKAGVLGGKIGRVTVLQLSMQEVRLTLELTDPSIALSPVNLLLAIPRPQILKKVLSVACELGISKVNLFVGNQSQKSYLSSHVLEPQELEYFLIKGLEQSGTTHLPKVSISDCLSSALELGSSASYVKLVAHGSKQKPAPTVEQLTACQLNSDQEFLVAIGPEGGWAVKELDQLKDQGFAQVSLGERMLRVDTAIAVLVGQLQSKI